MANTFSPSSRSRVTRERQQGENVPSIRVRYDLIDRQVPGNNVLLAGLKQNVLV